MVNDSGDLEMNEDAALSTHGSSPDIFDFEQHYANLALITSDGDRLTYGQLADLADSSVSHLGVGRQLVMISLRNSLPSLLAYAGAMRAGHTVLIVPEDLPPDRLKVLTETFDVSAGFLRDEEGWTWWRMEEGENLIHPDLALLLPTSGSTGSAKLVRLSRQAIDANAASIRQYLAIGPGERAITSLPCSYSYGLSVIHSHWLAGASILLTDASIVEPSFWDLLRDQAATSIAGVPYSYDVFDRLGLFADPPPDLRTFTQAGGKLDGERVRSYAQWAAANGRRFFTMYGQTEAAPRMAYLPAEEAANHPDCIGIPVPGGAFRLVDPNGHDIERAEQMGELVYAGPNVMMGYATQASDLARGADVAELFTGDLAQRTRAGYYRITGRASRFLKIAGSRIALDEVERLVTDNGYRAVASGCDAYLALCVEEGDPDAVGRLVAQQCGLPFDAVVACPGPMPRLASGKLDYQALLKQAATISAAASARPPWDGSPIRHAFEQALGREVTDLGTSFAELGGDSLSYVTASIGVQDALGTLPANWEALSIAQLEAMRGEPAEAATPKRTSSIDTEMVCRVLALALVILGHGAPAQTEWLRGGALILMALAGFNLARFQQHRMANGVFKPVIADALLRVVLPYSLLMIPLLLVSRADFSLGWFVLASVFTVDFRGPLFAFWFIETVIHSMLLTMALFLIPPVRAWSRTKPFLLALGFVALAAALKGGGPLFWSDGKANALTVDAWLYAYMVGWGMFAAQTKAQKWLIVVLAAALAFIDWGPDSARPIWLVLAVAAILFVPRLTMPRPAANAIMVTAQASYFIYLMHVIATHFLIARAPITPVPAVNSAVLLAVSIALGIGYYRGWRLVAQPALRHIGAAASRQLRPLAPPRSTV